MKTQKFMSEIENTYHKYFPASQVNVNFSRNIYSSIWIVCYLAGSKEEVYNKIWDNDILSVSFRIDTSSGEFSKDVDLDSELPDHIVLTNHAKSYHIKPENSYLVYSSRRLPFRLSEGNAEKIIKSFDSFCAKLKDSLTDDLRTDMIHDNHKELVAKKINAILL